ncbi:MAG: mechanosensitive ion channel family protein [Erysipelotrichaceae bacterium]|nr:mechanosensitive ion channel family protein [Erysipelotrichaceae bacterium]
MSLEEIITYGDSIFVDGLISFAINSIGLIVLGVLLKGFISKSLKKIISEENKSNSSFYIKVLNSLIYGVIIFLILSEIKPLKKIGSAVLGASSILAVVVGLAAQETLGNFVSGVILAIYQPFKIGDVIIIKEKNLSGTVTTIGFRHTIIRTPENTNIMVPNSVMNSAIIENRKTEIESYRNSLTINISYDSDLDKAKDIIKNNILSHPLLIDGRSLTQDKNMTPMINIYCTNLNEYSIELKARFYTKDFGSGFEMCSDLRQSILKEFDSNNISVPHPKTIVKHE